VRTSEQLTDLLQAMCQARAAFPPIVKNCTAQVRSEKGNYSFDYADLGAILDAVTPALTAHGLLLTFGLDEPAEGKLVVSARLWHCASAQYLENALTAAKPAGLTATGSLITYLRRYTSTALLGVCGEADEDGSAAEGSSIAVQALLTEPVSSNGHTPGPAPEPDASMEHPTESHLAALRNLALTECHEELEVFEDRLRRTMGVPKNASVSPRLLTKTMSMQAYMEVYGFYRRLEEQLLKAKGREAANGPAASLQPPPAAEPASTSTGEVPVDPSPAGSSSAASDQPVATDPAYHKLYQEALGWGVAETEIKHILDHHRDLAKCRTILWKARRNEPPPAWEKVETAA
jgi:hypothetical protein